MKIGDTVPVYERKAHNENVEKHTGTIVWLTKKFATVRFNSSERRFHKSNGRIVGYEYPTFTLNITPER